MSGTLGDDILNSLTAHVAVVDSAGVILAVNDAWKRFATQNACTSEAFYVGANYLEICEAALRRTGDVTVSAALSGIRAVLSGERNEFSLEYPCHSPEQRRWFVLRVTRLSRTAPASIVVAHEDITAQKKVENALRAAEQTLRHVLELLPVGVWVLDGEGRIVHGNPEGRKIWGGARYVTPDRFGEYRGWWLSTGEPIAAEQWGAARAIREGETSIGEEIRIQCFDGASKIILHSAIPLHDIERRIVGAIVVNQDITARKKQEEELLRTRENLEAVNRELQQSLAREQLMARTDSVTGLNNRRQFLELALHECAVAQRYGQPLSLVLFDIDRFKHINDTLGHQGGDEALRHVARIAGEHRRASDILARYGGDEFVLLLPGSSAEQALVAAERLREAAVAERMNTPAGEVAITVSAGISAFGSTGDSLEQLIHRADLALYAAKARGRNCTVLDSTLDAPRTERAR